MPLSNLVAGPLADRVTGPMMAEGGILSDTFITSLIGAGQERGVALVFIVSAIFLWVTSLYAFANPRIRNLEEEIPDAFTDEPEAEEEFGVKKEEVPTQAAVTTPGD